MTTTIMRGALGGLAISLLAGVGLALAAPAISITSGPAEGSTTAADSVTFAFTVDSASTTECSIVGASEQDSFFACGSPQEYELPPGTYRFAVQATDEDGTASTSRTFTLEAPEEDEDSGGGGGGGSDNESTPRSSPGGIVRYQTPIVPGERLVAIRPGSSAASNVASAQPAPTVAVAPPTPRSTVAAAPRRTSQATAPAPAPTVAPAAGSGQTSTTSATSGAFTTAPAGAALGLATEGGQGIPNWLWALLLFAVVVGVGTYAYQQSQRA